MEGKRPDDIPLSLSEEFATKGTVQVKHVYSEMLVVLGKME